jgi:hypothetical protein
MIHSRMAGYSAALSVRCFGTIGLLLLGDMGSLPSSPPHEASTIAMTRPAAVAWWVPTG